MGGFLIVYTVAGGAKAVAYTQQLQLVIIFSAMFFAGYMIVHRLPEGVGFVDALQVGGKLGKLNVITTGVQGNKFDWGDKYNIWSGVIGGFFLALSYFGTDQSQVGRYLTAQNNRESRLGLLMNGLVKVPMQFLILLIGILVFTFYQFNTAPITFNNILVNQVQSTEYKDSLQVLQTKYDSINSVKKLAIAKFVAEKNYGDNILSDSIRQLNKQSETYRNEFKNIYVKATGKVKDEANDTNYVFLSFVKDYLPIGLKGLLIAVIFLAAWGSIAAALNSLSSSTVVDFHKRHMPAMTDLQEYRLSKWYTFGWGIFCILIAQFAGKIGESLIEAVNILGSLFYGVILGVFLVAFYFKKIGGTATFCSALITEAFIILLFFNEHVSFFSFLPDIGFLWLNVVGAFGVIFIGWVLQTIIPAKREINI
jgi:Na+/proline symporter